MHRARLNRSIVLLGFVAVAGVIPGCVNHACPAIGCTDIATLRLTVPATAPWMFPLKLKTCRNEECQMADIPAPIDGQSSFAQFTSSSESLATQVSATLTLHAGSDNTLAILWSIINRTARNGDRYTATVTDADGVALVMLDKTATYKQHHANDDCPQPCVDATLMSDP